MSTTAPAPRYPDFGRLVERHLERTGLSQRAVGAKVGVSQQQINHYKSGENAPSGPHLSRLVEVLDMDAAEVIEALSTRSRCFLYAISTLLSPRPHPVHAM